MRCQESRLPKMPFHKKKITVGYRRWGHSYKLFKTWSLFQVKTIFAPQRWRGVVFVTLSPDFTGKPGRTVHATFSKWILHGQVDFVTFLYYFKCLHLFKCMEPLKKNLICFICPQDLPDIFVTLLDFAVHEEFRMHLKMCSFPNSLNSVR